MKNMKKQITGGKYDYPRFIWAQLYWKLLNSAINVLYRWKSISAVQRFKSVAVYVATFPVSIDLKTFFQYPNDS